MKPRFDTFPAGPCSARRSAIGRTLRAARNRAISGAARTGAAIAVLMFALAGPAAARIDPSPPASGSAALLAAQYAALKDELSNNPFKRPIHLDSAEGKDRVSGEIYAIVNAPFATAGGVLDKPAHWCDILLLHLNNKYCKPETAARATALHVAVGTKNEQSLADAFHVNFAYRVAARTAEYLQVRLEADEGPLSTRDYKILFEAIPAENGRTFIHLSYAYGFGMVGQLAMKTYLNTVARNKVGFTAVPDGRGAATPVGGMRGAVERNTMRYYLAIEAFLGAMTAPPETRMENAFREWFAATESYSRQLHEIPEQDYLAMKRKEYSRQQSALN
jgi:hypothetical protein